MPIIENTTAFAVQDYIPSTRAGRTRWFSVPVAHSASLPLWESRLGRIIGTDGEGRPVVDFEGNPVGPRVARKAVRLDV